MNRVTYDPTTGRFGYRRNRRTERVVLCVVIALACAGCSNITVNVLSSRMINLIGTNTAQQATEGGAVVSSNALTAPLKGMP
jgi:hypothetical protein